MTQQSLTVAPAPIANPHLSDALRAVSARVCERWSAAAGAPANLEREIPTILSSLADELNGKAPRSPETATDAPTKTSEDPSAGGPIGEVLAGYGILRRVLLEEVSQRLGRHFLTTEVVTLTDAIERMVQQAVAAHANYLARQVQAANENQAKCLSFLSHDLRGGLNGVFLMVEVLRRELADKEDLAETLDDLELMRHSILDTVATMDRFIYAERFRKGKVRVKPGPMSLKMVLGEIGSRFAHLAREEGIDLQVEITERADIVSDRELLLLILHNLVANAMRYAGKGLIRIAACRGENGWRVEVTDQGPGIPSVQLEKIQLAFQNPAPDQPGPGLGLSLASQAAVLIGVKLQVDSTLGQGSRFHFDLPLKIGA